MSANECNVRNTLTPHPMPSIPSIRPIDISLGCFGAQTHAHELTVTLDNTLTQIQMYAFVQSIESKTARDFTWHVYALVYTYML